MQKKEPRDATLYYRVKRVNKKWVEDAAKQNGYKSEAEFMDVTLDELRLKKQSAKKQDDRRKK